MHIAYSNRITCLFFMDFIFFLNYAHIARARAYPFYDINFDSCFFSVHYIRYAAMPTASRPSMLCTRWKWIRVKTNSKICFFSTRQQSGFNGPPCLRFCFFSVFFSSCCHFEFLHAASLCLHVEMFWRTKLIKLWLHKRSLRIIMKIKQTLWAKRGTRFFFFFKLFIVVIYHLTNLEVN